MEGEKSKKGKFGAFINALLQPTPKVLADKKATEDVNLTLEKLTVLTYNVWFADLLFDIRAKTILQLILDNNPDIVCLQEVLPEFVRNHLAKDKRIRDRYKYISDTTGDSVHPYGVVLLSRYPMARLREIKLETGMGRVFLLGDFMINGSLVGIGTVHLESLGTSHIRAAQLRTIADTLTKGYDHWIVMGDFNFDSEINFAHGLPPLENDVMKEIIPNAIDTWLYINKDKSSGKTYDSNINKVIRKWERMRYDRVMLQSPANPSNATTPSSANPANTNPPSPSNDGNLSTTSNDTNISTPSTNTSTKSNDTITNISNPGVWVPTQARLIGTEPIKPNHYSLEDVWPSDHFGVFVEFAFNKVDT